MTRQRAAGLAILALNTLAALMVLTFYYNPLGRHQLERLLTRTSHEPTPHCHGAP